MDNSLYQRLNGKKVSIEYSGSYGSVMDGTVVAIYTEQNETFIEIEKKNSKKLINTRYIVYIEERD